MTPHQTPPSVTDEMVERLAREIAPNMGDSPEIAWAHLKARGEHRQYLDIASKALTAALVVQPGSGWRPIETAPKDGEVLAYWPAVKLDDEGELTSEPAGRGLIGVAIITNGTWDEPEALNAVGSSFDDDWSYASEPTHWQPLPAPPEDAVRKCPTCNSTAPHLHPAVQHGGVVETCTDDFHLTPTPQNTPAYIARVHEKRAATSAPTPAPVSGEREELADLMAQGVLCNPPCPDGKVDGRTCTCAAVATALRTPHGLPSGVDEEVRKALQFYADAWKCKPNKRYGGMEWSPTEALLDDCGEMAKQALSRLTASSPACPTCGDTRGICPRMDVPNCPRRAVAQPASREDGK